MQDQTKKVLSSMDGCSGYNHILLAPKYEEFTAFHTPNIPFGLKNTVQPINVQCRKFMMTYYSRFNATLMVG